MKIAVITGASAGIGREFALRIDEKSELDEIWLIARRESRLKEMAQSMKTKTKILGFDLAKEESLAALRNQIAAEKPQIQILVNAAGFGKFGSVASQTPSDAENMINVNVRALTSLTQMCLPYMAMGGSILNMASVSGYLPLPQLNIYAATKAYILHFSQALADELKDKKIRVTAVCPYWVSSEFISVAEDTAEGDAVNQFFGITYPYAVAKKALCDSERGKMLSLCGILPKMIRCLSRSLPVKCQFAIWNKTRRFRNSQCSPQSPVQSPLP